MFKLIDLLRSRNLALMDMERYLPNEEYQEFEIMTQVLLSGYPLNSTSFQHYIFLLNKARWKKRKEIAEIQARKHKGELRTDKSKLRMCTNGIQLSTRQEAIEHFAKHFPQFVKQLEQADPAYWLPKVPARIIDSAEKQVSSMIQNLTAEIHHPETIGHGTKIWIVFVPFAQYEKHGIDSLVWYLIPYAVITVTLFMIEHEKTFEDWTYTFNLSNRPIAAITRIVTPNELNTVSQKMMIPLSLLNGLLSGNIQPPNCEIIKQEHGNIIYKVEGFPETITITEDFFNFVIGFKDCTPKDSYEKFFKSGFLEQTTAMILEAKTTNRPIELPKVRHKDRGYLMKIKGIEHFLTYSDWGRAIRLSREGAYRTLQRLEDMGLITTEKHTSGEGIKVSLTTVGLSVVDYANSRPKVNRKSTS